jgi:hypothetical protein
LLCLPGVGLQLPFSPAAFPGAGSNPGQQVWAVDGLRRRDDADFAARPVLASDDVRDDLECVAREE